MGEDHSGDESESGSSSSEEEVEVDPADMEQIMKLESQLSQNPNVYDAHLQVGPADGSLPGRSGRRAAT